MFWPNSYTLRALSCMIGSDKVQEVLWRSHNLPVAKRVKNVVALCGTKNLNWDLSKDVTDGIIEAAGTFKTKYRSVSIFVCGTLSGNFS